MEPSLLRMEGLKETRFFRLISVALGVTCPPAPVRDYVSHGAIHVTPIPEVTLNQAFDRNIISHLVINGNNVAKHIPDFPQIVGKWRARDIKSASSRVEFCKGAQSYTI